LTLGLALEARRAQMRCREVDHRDDRHVDRAARPLRAPDIDGRVRGCVDNVFMEQLRRSLKYENGYSDGKARAGWLSFFATVDILTRPWQPHANGGLAP
ncbi:hypothetical protein, partial [Mesorhizobium sp. M0522]|uniref:hypothetical protein n=1 Tax=Mesorhizobium sp. M0522 TaxID=2956958 RepID=UPI0033385853